MFVDQYYWLNGCCNSWFFILGQKSREAIKKHVVAVLWLLIKSGLIFLRFAQRQVLLNKPKEPLIVVIAYPHKSGLHLLISISVVIVHVLKSLSWFEASL